LKIGIDFSITNPSFSDGSGPPVVTFFVISNLNEPIIDELGNNLVFM